jgi:hypothetical protein
MRLDLQADPPHWPVEQASVGDVLRGGRRTGQLAFCGACVIRLRRDGKRHIPDPFGPGPSVADRWLRAAIQR